MLHGTLIFTYMNDEQIHGKCEFCGFGIPYMESLWAINWGIHIKWLNMNPFLPFLESVPSWFCLVIPVRFFLNPWGGGNPSVLNVIFNPSSMNHPMATPGINLSNSQGLTVWYNQIKNWPNKPQGHKGSKQNQYLRVVPSTVNLKSTPQSYKITFNWLVFGDVAQLLGKRQTLSPDQSVLHRDTITMYCRIKPT